MLEVALKDLPFDYIIGTKLPIGDTGINLDNDIEIISGMKKKDKVLNEFEGKNVDWENSKAFGDSLYDRFLMELTNNPTAVTPDDDLRSYANKNNWNIID
jgi:phosphoserine phosphatase